MTASCPLLGHSTFFVSCERARSFKIDHDDRDVGSGGVSLSEPQFRVGLVLNPGISFSRNHVATPAYLSKNFMRRSPRNTAIRAARLQFLLPELCPE